MEKYISIQVLSIGTNIVAAKKRTKRKDNYKF